MLKLQYIKHFKYISCNEVINHIQTIWQSIVELDHDLRKKIHTFKVLIIKLLLEEFFLSSNIDNIHLSSEK